MCVCVCVVSTFVLLRRLVSVSGRASKHRLPRKPDSKLEINRRWHPIHTVVEKDQILN